MVDYSVHPPTRIGLHNAMLSQNDRMEILEAHGGQYQCDVYVVEGVHAHILTQEMAIDLFNALPHGEVKWTTIREFLLPKNNDAERPTPAPVPAEEVTHERQLHLFEGGHTPYEDKDTVTIHHLDIDA